MRGRARRIGLAACQLERLDRQRLGIAPALRAPTAASNAGQPAPIFNVGPLHEPLTQTQCVGASENSASVPEKLFSHSVQQVLLETAASAANDAQACTGWGGRACDVLGTANPLIALGHSGRFSMAGTQNALMSSDPNSIFGAYGLQLQDMAITASAARRSAVDALCAKAQDVGAADTFNQIQRGRLCGV